MNTPPRTDLAHIKDQFPLFGNQAEGFAYLDNAATTQKPRTVLDALAHFYTSLNSNIHRVLLNDSSHFPMLDEAATFNRLLADFLGAEDLSQLQLKKHWVRRVR